MTYRVCEDAPCCGCCGTSVYGPAESSPEFDWESMDGLWSDPMESDYDPYAGTGFDGYEDSWLDGSYEE